MKHDLDPYSAYQVSGLPWAGRIPAHWRVMRAKFMFRRVQRQPLLGDGVVTCFRDGTVTLRRNRRLEGFTESVKEEGYQRVLPGDLVIHSMDAFAGAVGVSDSAGKCTPVYSVCQPLDDASPDYFARVVREMARTQWIASMARGIRQRSSDFRYETFSAQALPVPPMDEQDSIVRFLRDFDNRFSMLVSAFAHLVGNSRSATERDTSLLHEYRTRLISDVVTGKLDVREEAARLPDEVEESELLNDAEVLSGRFDEGDDSSFLDTDSEEVGA